MAEKVLIQGESGTGKSSSIRTLNPETTAIVSPEKERLPFRTPTPIKMLTGVTDANAIIRFMDESVKEGKKVIIIDDFQYILAIPYMHRIKEAGWDKYNDFGGNYFDIVDHCKKLPDDVIVYFMTHVETLEDGITRTKLIGKLLREKITIEGLFTIVLRTLVAEGKYYFTTQNSGKDTTKSPFGMFPTYAIDNDLNYVTEKIRNYYFMDGSKSDAEMEKVDQEVAAPEIVKPEPRTRRSRASETPASTNAPVEEKPTRTRRSRTLAAAVEESKEESSDYMKDVSDVLDEVPFDEVPFDEVVDAVEKKQSRRRRNRG